VRRVDHSSRGILPTVAHRCVLTGNLVIRGGHSSRWAADPEKIINWCICWFFTHIQCDPKKRELLKCVVAAMYIWQHCGTGTLSYRQPRHLVIMDQWNGQQCAVAIKMFYIFGFFKSSRFFGSPCIKEMRGSRSKIIHLI
jgi:hypothetical protein